jgi:hypothetical protein
MMCSDYGAVDHVGGGVSLHQTGKRFEHRVEHASLNPSSVAAEDAVPLAIFVGQMPPLRARPRHPHHTLKIEPVVLRRTATSPTFRRKQWPDQSPLIVRYTNSLAQGCLPKDSLESTDGSHVNLCPRNLELIEELKVGAPRHEHEVASIINKPTNQADTSTDTP